MIEADRQRIVETIHCETAEKFLEELSPRNPRYDSLIPHAWIFRGHGDHAFELRPSALRYGDSWAEFVPFTPANNQEQAFEESELLRRFLTTADGAGLSVPEDNQHLRALLYKTADLAVEEWPPNEVLSLMAIAQHHGVPTRLLDWSKNPLKAAWFALHDAADMKHCDRGPCVWALHAEVLELIATKWSAPFATVSAPTASNANLRAQEGIFTLASRITQNRFPVDTSSFDELLWTWVHDHRIETTRPWFVKIVLPKIEAQRGCFLLEREGINQAAIYPDFYGVAKSMKDWVRSNLAPGSPGYLYRRQLMNSLLISREFDVSASTNVFRQTSTLGQDINKWLQKVPTSTVDIMKKVRPLVGKEILTFGIDPEAATRQAEDLLNRKNREE